MWKEMPSMGYAQGKGFCLEEGKMRSNRGGMWGNLALPPWLSSSYVSLILLLSFMQLYEAFNTSSMCKLNLGNMPIYGEVMSKIF